MKALENSVRNIRKGTLDRIAYSIGIRHNEPLRYSVEDALADISEVDWSGRTIIAFFGHMFIENQLQYVRSLRSAMTGYEFVIIDERCTWDGHLLGEGRCFRLEDGVWILNVPDILWKDTYPRFQAREPVPDISHDPVLMEAADNLRCRHYDMGRGYPEYVIEEGYRYFLGILMILSPALVVMWNQFHALHQVLGKACVEYGIPTMYMEFGLLPHTYSFDTVGQMGRSSFPEGSKDAPTREASDHAMTYIAECVRELCVHTSDFETNHKKPIVLYLGQNDFESGMVPYTEDSKRYHSPVFRDTIDGLHALSSICRSNGWTLVFRPHPIFANFELMRGCYRFAQIDTTSRIEDLIMESDVIVTILSRSAYTALMLGKPVVMLGYTQLRGSGCTYEAFDIDSIEPAIRHALVEGLTSTMRLCFLDHTSNLLSSYLFDDLTGHDAGMRLDKLSRTMAAMCMDASIVAEDGYDCER